VNALTVLLVICAALSVFVAVEMFRAASVFEDAGSSLRQLRDANDAATGSFAFLSTVMLATGVVWIVWQFRHAKNAQVLGRRLGLGPAWAIAGWFIPIASFVLPQIQLYQSAVGAKPMSRDVPVPDDAPIPFTFWAWVVLFDAAGILTSIGFSMIPSTDQLDISFGRGDQLDQAVRGQRLAGIGAIVFVLAAFAAIAVVRRLSQRQDAALDRALGTGGPTSVWPGQPTWTQPYPLPATQYPPPPPYQQPPSPYPQPQQPYPQYPPPPPA
jgi:hypothetical protein